MIKKGVLVTGAVSAAVALLHVGWPGWVTVLLVFVLIYGVIFTRRGNDGACRLMATYRGDVASPQVKASKKKKP